MLIENGILKAYDSDMKNVVIPEGVRVIVGNVEDSDRGKHLQGVKTDGVFYFPFNAYDSIETVNLHGTQAGEPCAEPRGAAWRGH